MASLLEGATVVDRSAWLAGRSRSAILALRERGATS